MKFKSKSLISIILSIMMVISMIIVPIPANAAVIDGASVGADTYYIWYNLNNNNAITSSGAWSSKAMNTSDNGTTYYYDITSEGQNIFVNFNQSSSSATASSSIWSDSESARKAVTNNSTVVTSFGGQNFSSYNFLRLYAAKGATFRITYSPSLKTVVLSDVSSDPTGSTVASSTTPVSTNSWVLTGDNYGSWDASKENAVKLSLVSGKTNLYSASVSSLSGYFGFYLKSGESYNQYGPSNNGAPLPNSSADAATISSGTGKAFNIQSAVSNVTVYLDDSNSSSIKVWYESSTEPTTTEPVETTVPPTTAPFTPATPVSTVTDENGTTKTSFEVGESFLINVTKVENGVTYSVYLGDTPVGDNVENGKIKVVATAEMIGDKTFTVKATYGEKVVTSTVNVTVTASTDVRTIKIYFKTATAPAYAPSVSFDGGDALKMSDPAPSDVLGKDYSGALTFAWYSVEIPNVDTTKIHALTFTSKRTKLNATWNGKLTSTASYFTADNLMSGTVAVNLTDKGVAERNFFYSATNMVYDSTDAKNKTLGFTFVGNARVKMGTVVNVSNGTVTPVSAPTVKSATYIQMVNASMITVSSLQSELYDVNFDGKVDIKDATYIQYALAS